MTVVRANGLMPAMPAPQPAMPAPQNLEPVVLSEVLSDLLAYTRALADVEQSFHWRTSGPSFYSDHLLFERLYGGTYADIDGMAEKLMGLTGAKECLSPLTQAAKVVQIVQEMGLSEDPAQFTKDCLRVEQALVAVISATLDVCQAQMTDGLENFLQGIADKHEGHIYLLRQVVAA